MKRKLYLLIATMSLAFISSCMQDLTEDGRDGDITLTGQFETPTIDENTKAVMGEGYNFIWKGKDKIKLLLTNGGTKNFVLQGAGGTAQGTFSGSLSSGETLSNKIIYPTSCELTSTSLTATLPATYNYGAPLAFTAGTDPSLDLPCFAKIENSDFTMNFLTGFLLFDISNIPAGAKSFEFDITNGKRINGSFTADVTADMPQLSEQGAVSEDETKVVINFSPSTSVTSRCFMIPVPVGSYTYEWYILGEDEYDVLGFGEQEKAVNVARGAMKVKHLACASVGGGEDPNPATVPNNEIWYTSTDGNVVSPYDANAFGVNIVSNTYENGKGIIKFDGEVTSIGERAFMDCSRLTSFEIPNSVTSFEFCSLYGCTSLTSVVIPDSITEIGWSAFCGCSSLTSVEIPNSVTTINRYAFTGCSGITSFTGKFASEDNRCLIVDGVLKSFAPAGLTTYTIPNSVTSIEQGAFRGCSGLTSIEIPNSVTSIGVESFFGCSGLTSIEIPNSVISIGESAFRECYSLESFTGNFASDDNRCLIVNGVLNSFAPSGLTAYTIPNSVTEIGDYSFIFCSDLTSVTIPNSVISIGNYAFFYCYSLTSVEIGTSVTSIGWDAFCGCSSLTSVEIPNSVTSISSGAFYGCESLTSVYCKPATPPNLGDTVYDGTSSSLKIYVQANSVNDYKAADGWSEYADQIVSDALHEINNVIYYTSSDGNVVIPSALNTFGIDISDDFGADLISNTYENGLGKLVFNGEVTSIGNYAFSGCSNLVSIEIPNSVTVIGKRAFQNCGRLISIEIPSSVTSLGDMMFYQCSGLESFTGKFASNDNRCLIDNGVLKAFAPAGLASYEIPSSVTSIGYGAFESYSSLKSIVIPDSVTNIEEWAFSGSLNIESFTGKFTSEDNRCLIVDGALKAFAPAGLTSYSIPNSVSEIGEGVFRSCSLTSIEIPNSVISIGKSVFEYSHLTSVEIPNSVTSIGNYAFHGCSSLTSMHCKPITPPSLGTYTFSGTSSDMSVYVPRSSVDEYKAAANWSEYASQIEGYDF